MFYIIVPKCVSGLDGESGRYLTASLASEAVELLQKDASEHGYDPDTAVILNGYVDGAVLDLNGLQEIAEEENA